MGRQSKAYSDGYDRHEGRGGERWRGRAGDAEKVISSGSCLELEMRMPTPSGVRGFRVIVCSV